MRYTFADVSINTSTFTVVRDGKPQHVEPRVFDLIAQLVSQPGHVFSKDQLLATVWKGRVVSDATVATAIKQARAALGDDGQSQHIIETVRGRGFRWIAEVQAAEAPPPDPAAAPEASWQPSVAVLPVRAATEQSSDRSFAEQLRTELRTLLTHLPVLRVQSEADAAGDYQVEIALHRVGGQLSVYAGLTDGAGGFQRWGRTMDVEVAKSSASELAIAVVSQLEPQIYLAIYQTIGVSNQALTAQLLFLKAESLLVARGWHHDSFAEATALLEQAVAQEPDFALGQALRSFLIAFRSRVGLETTYDNERRVVTEAADRALALEPMNSVVLGLTGCALADVGDLQRGEALLRHAIDLNDRNAQALVALGSVCLLKRQSDEAVELLTRGVELSPLDPRLSIWEAVLALAHLLRGDIDAALHRATLACQRNDRTYMPRIARAAAALVAKDVTTAAQALADARRIKPDLSAEQVDRLIGESLRKALFKLTN